MEEKILEILAEICEDDIVKDNKEIELYDAGLLDSLTFAELLLAIEEHFHIIIAPSEIDRSDINTPQKIIDLIKMRQQQ